MPKLSLRRHVLHHALWVAAIVVMVPLPSGAFRGDCAQPSTDGQIPVASDCLFILRTAVALHGCSPECICDTNGSGSVLASDAHLCLRFAVRQSSAVLACACEPTTTSSTTTTTTLPNLPCELFVNGDLEFPVTASPENGWSFANVDGSAGWTSDGGNPGGYFTLNQAGELGTDPELSQTVNGLTPDATYRISGQYRSFAAGFGDPNKQDAFAVRVEPAPQGSASSIVLGLPRPSPEANEWTGFFVDFVASDATVTVSFLAERDGDDSSFDIDNLCLGVP